MKRYVVQVDGVRWLVLGLGLFGAIATTGQNAHQYLRKGDRAYLSSEYQDAEEQYRRALVQEESVKGRYNLGNATYQQERYEESVPIYERAAREAKDPGIQARAFHNLGNAHFQAGDYEKAVEAYKKALRIRPKDMDTKYNLALAQWMLPPPQPQQNQQTGQEEQDPEEGDQPPPEGSPEEQGSPQESPSQEQEASRQPEPSEALSREEALQLLEIMGQEEEKVMGKLRNQEDKDKKSGKDW